MEFFQKEKLTFSPNQEGKINYPCQNCYKKIKPSHNLIQTKVGCGFESQLQPNIFLFQCLNLGLANGAKVGPKLRLGINLEWYLSVMMFNARLKTLAMLENINIYKYEIAGT